MAVSKRLRFEIFRRDDHKCRYCGGQAPEVRLTVDHVIPVAIGGSDEPSNLVTACVDCNAGKSSISPDSQQVADVSERAQRWAAAVSQAASERLQRVRELDQLEEWFVGEWEQYGNLPRGDWLTSVARFISLGVSTDEMFRFMEIAWDKRPMSLDARWRYFCGCCWNAVNDIRERAFELADEAEPGD